MCLVCVLGHRQWISPWYLFRMCVSAFVFCVSVSPSVSLCVCLSGNVCLSVKQFLDISEGPAADFLGLPPCPSLPASPGLCAPARWPLSALALALAGQVLWRRHGAVTRQHSLGSRYGWQGRAPSRLTLSGPGVGWGCC